MNKIIIAFSGEQERYLLWSPLWLMLGIGGYFSLSNEPAAWLGAALLGIGALALACTWRHALRWPAFALFLMALGFAGAQWRAQRVATPLLSEVVYNREVEGTIAAIEPFEKKAKLVLAAPRIEEVEAQDTPLNIRVSFRHPDPDWQVGDRLRFAATLYPLPPPNMPGAYDFARHFYFRGIGGTGFALRAPEVVGKAAQSGFAQWLGNLRHRIGEDMRAHMPGAAGAVAAAMTVGETGPIPQETKDLMRDAGLSHMLAIAGLHLGIVAGIVFFNMRLLLTLYPPLALRVSAKKIAALLALISALIYLLLAGSPIPAQRAFIAVAFLFGAMLLDRRGVTLRTLAFAACFILLLFPEAMYGASFQLSFAATLAIISLFERYGGQLSGHGLGFRQRLWRHALGIAATSLVATLATAPFILYNFNRFASFGLLTNMLVVPLATFVLMPAIVLSLLLMPLGWQQIGYAPLEWGMHAMFALSRWVINLPHASIRLPAPSDAGLGLATLGLMWLCLWRPRWRLLGAPLMLFGLATIAQHRPFDLMVSYDATKVALRLTNGEYLFLRGRPSSFAGQVWLRSEGQEDGLLLKDVPGAPWLHCDGTACTVDTPRRRIVVARRDADWQALCQEKVDIIIAEDYLSPADCPQATLRLDRAFLDAHGAVAIRFGRQGVEMETAESARGKRLWNGTNQMDY